MALARSHDLLMIDGLWQFHGLAVWRTAQRLALPYVVCVHGMLDPWFGRRYPLKHLKKLAYWPWAEYRILRDARLVFFTTELERDLARHSFWPYAAREQVVGYGTEAPPDNAAQQRQAFMAAHPELEGKRMLLFLGRIHPKKGTDLLIRAFAHHADRDPRLHLVIAGPDGVGWQRQLMALAQRLGITDRITWTGMLEGEHKWGALWAAELFCLPSHQENFGIAVTEALACGVPVLLGQPVNIAATVEQAGAGIVHADTASATTTALGQWLGSDTASQQRMAKRARDLFERRFELSQTAMALASALLPVAP
jgi:glycosyltransferase involved in cell wall biosynthesis